MQKVQVKVGAGRAGNAGGRAAAGGGAGPGVRGPGWAGGAGGDGGGPTERSPAGPRRGPAGAAAEGAAGWGVREAPAKSLPGATRPPPPSSHLLPPPRARGWGVGAVLAGVVLTGGERGRCRGPSVEGRAHGRRRWVVARC